MRMFVATTQKSVTSKKTGKTRLKEVRIASGSFTTIKKEMRDGAREWTLAFYEFKPDVPTLVQIISNFSELEASWVESWEVSETGRLKMISHEGAEIVKRERKSKKKSNSKKSSKAKK